MKSSEYQKGRGHQINVREELDEVAPGIFLVKSQSSDKVYQVTSNSCECLGARYGGICSHQTAVRIFKRTQNLVKSKAS